MKERSSGVLLPVFSLPGPYGIGTLGREARAFVDFLHKAGQHWWQILPLGPVGPGNSPYMSPSAFAGNPLLLDPEALARDGLLTPSELSAAELPGPVVDYDALRRRRLPLLAAAWRRWSAGGGEDWPDRPRWVDPWCRWAASRELYGPSDPRFYLFLELTFRRQWAGLKAYANERNVRILGDMPIYVSPAGADAACRPELFLRDGDGAFSSVAGVPPDYFSEDGQLWGNPLYDWQGHRRQLFAWWRERVRHCATLYDGLRIDHFRGLDRYWAVPAGAETARGGRWEEGPGCPLVRVLRRAAGPMELIAEDLGVLDERVMKFFASAGLPGMSVLVYSFGPDRKSPYLPHNCPVNKVIYTSTHDSPTFLQWLEEDAAPEERAFALDYLDPREDGGPARAAVRAAWASPCILSVAPLQDVLGLGSGARVNLPGTTGPHNWSWRVRGELLTDDAARQLYALTRTFGRLAEPGRST